MKQYNQHSIFVFLLFCIYLSCNNKSSNQSESDLVEIKENYGTGELSRFYTRLNGKIEGKMTDYYPSGAVKGERYFSDDKQDGKTTLYYENGQIKEVQYYINGLRNGGDTIFYEGGHLKYVSEFRDEKQNGYLRKWDEDGSLVYEAKFNMDTLVEVEGKPIKTTQINK
ncbi:MAG: hypothetical protein WAU01_07985 [Saprospiraceae bacterium]